MSSSPLTLWDRAQLLGLRLLSTILGLMDRAFHVDWGERVLGRMSRKWEGQLEQLDEVLAQLELEREQLQIQSEALAIHAAAVYLASRNLAHDKLRFDPQDSHDDEILDATIDLLVKQRLASIETNELEDGHFVYILEPDWAAILESLRAAADQADPEVAEWFQEGIRFIDSACLHQTEPPGEQEPNDPHQE